MKNILIVIMTLISTISFAGACEHSEENLICPGDDVVVVLDSKVNEADPIRSGQIVGINAQKKEAVYRWYGLPRLGIFIGNHEVQESIWWNSTTPIKNISVKYGCIFGVCVNDKVVYRNMRAQVLAVSSYTDKVILSTESYLYEVDPSELASTTQCADYGPAARSVKYYLKK